MCECSAIAFLERQQPFAFAPACGRVRQYSAARLAPVNFLRGLHDLCNRCIDNMTICVLTPAIHTSAG